MVCITCEAIGEIMDIHAVINMLITDLVIIGALNWGLVGLLGLDLVAKIFGTGTVLAKVVYILVGVSGLIMLLRMLGVAVL